MAPTRTDAGTTGRARLHRYRWWIAGAATLLAVGALLVLDVDALIEVLAVALGLLFWGPFVVAWSRGLWKSGKAFREGLDGR